MPFNIIKKNPTAGEVTSSLTNASDAAGLHFDGAGSIDISSPPDLGTKFSFEFILQADSFGSTNLYFVDFGNGGRFIFGTHSSTSYNWAIFDNSSWQSFGVKVLDDLKVHHLTLTVDGTSAVLYDNSNQVGTATISASHGIDNCSDLVIGSAYSSAVNLFNGTIYRARLWNKTLSQAEITSVYESASLDFADQWGSQTELVTNGDFASATGWALDSNWAISGGAATADGTNSNKLSQDLGAQLVLGKTYRYSFDWTRTSGTSLGFQYNNGVSGYVDIATITDTGSGTATGSFTIETGTNGYIYFRATGSWAGTIDNVTVVASGCVSDFDFSYSNPTQSNIVRNRNDTVTADGTAAGGVVQVTPIDQLNSKSARIGTSAATPADGQVLANSGKIQNSAWPVLEVELSGGSASAAQLKVTADDGDKAVLEVAGSTSAISGLSQGDAVLYATNNLQFGTSNDRTARLTIDSAGQVGIGVAPNISGASANNTFLSVKGKATAYGGVVELANYGTNGNGQTLGAVRFFDNTVKTAEVEVVRESANDDAKMVFKTKPTGGSLTDRLTIASTGLATFSAGINLGNTASATATTLDGYEEGTFTVTTNSDATGAFNSETGEYTRIGNCVYIRIAIDVSTTFTSNFLGGLPFQADVDHAGSSWAVIGPLLKHSTSDVVLSAVQSSTSIVRLYAGGNLDSDYLLNSTDRYYRFSGFYYTTDAF